MWRLWQGSVRSSPKWVMPLPGSNGTCRRSRGDDMPRTLYYEQRFVTLHQKNPGYNTGNNDGNPYFEIAGLKTSVRKYSVHFGFGDPGEVPAYDNFDYAEFQVGQVTWDKPADLNASGTYQTEGLGSSHTSTYKKWWSLTVPDNHNPGLNSGIPLPPWNGPLSPNSDGLFGHYAFSPSGISASVTFDTGNDIVGGISEGLSLANFKSAGVGSVLEALSKAGKAAGFGAIGDTIENASIVHNALNGVLNNGLDLIDKGMTGLSGNGYTAGQFQAEADKFFGETNETFQQALIDVNMFPGNPGAEQFADRVLEAVRVVHQVVPPQPGVILGYVGSNVEIEIDIPTGEFSDLLTLSANVDIAIDGARDSTIDAGDGSDVVDAGPGRDTIYGRSGNDRIHGGSGNDVIDGGQGTDLIDGGGGFDRGRQDGQAGDYEIKRHADGVTTLRSKSNPGEVDLYRNVERVEFGDRILALDTASGDNAGNAYRIYKAAFDRDPDEQGLSFWTKWLDDGKTDPWNMAARFIDSREFEELYGSRHPANDEYMWRIYRNVLDRDPDQGGYDWWLQRLNDGIFSQSEVLARFSDSQENRDNVAPRIQDGAFLSYEYFFF